VVRLLDSLTSLMNSVGIKTGWRAIQGAPDFFSITKKMQNALQGGDFNLTEMKMEISEDVVYKDARKMTGHAFCLAARGQ
jgi:trehalose synthase